MPYTYIQDVKKTVDALSRDEGLILEEKLILLGMVSNYIEAVTKRLEEELASDASGLDQ